MIKITDLVGHESMFIGLNIGCGNNCIDGWLNTDLYPVGGGGIHGCHLQITI